MAKTSNTCLIRCVCKKSFLSFPYISVVIKKICIIKTNLLEIRKALLPPPPTPTPSTVQLNFRHCICVAVIFVESQSEKFMASKLQVTASKLQVTASKLQVMPTKLQVTPSSKFDKFDSGLLISFN